MLEYVECKFSGQVDVKERNLIYFILKVTLYVNIWSKNCMLQIWIVLFSTRLFCETCQFSFLDWQNNLRAIRCKHHDTEMEKMRKKNRLYMAIRSTYQICYKNMKESFLCLFLPILFIFTFWHFRTGTRVT